MGSADDLMDENARLKGMVAKLERKLTDQNASVVQLQVQAKTARAMIKTQDAHIAKISALVVDSTQSKNSTTRQEDRDQRLQNSEIEMLKATVQRYKCEAAQGKAKAEEEINRFRAEVERLNAEAKSCAQELEGMQNLQAEVQRYEEAAKRMDKVLAQLREENEKAVGDMVSLKRKMMPCYQVGYWVRQKNREEDVVRRGGKSSWFDASNLCDCSTHYADPLADASIISFTEELEDAYLTDSDQWVHFKQQYYVSPTVVLDSRDFTIFLEILKGYANMQRYVSEGSTSAAEGAKFLEDSKKLIEKIFPLGLFNCDEDIEQDVKAWAAYVELQDIHGYATLKHRTFAKGAPRVVG